MTYARLTLDRAKPSVRELVGRVRQILEDGEYLPSLTEIGGPIGYKSRQAVSRVLNWWLEPEELELMDIIRIFQQAAKNESRQSKPRKVMDRQAAVRTKKRIYGENYFKHLGHQGGSAKGRSLKINHKPKKAVTAPEQTDRR